MIGKYIIGAIIGVIVLDLFCFSCWAMSGQVPQDKFYLGAITGSILSQSKDRVCFEDYSCKFVEDSVEFIDYYY